jgi:pantothenate kinase
MDGFHYYRAELDAMDNPQEAHARRGAPWTFNASKFVACVRSAREMRCGVFPSFDHAIGDPLECSIEVRDSCKP